MSKSHVLINEAMTLGEVYCMEVAEPQGPLPRLEMKEMDIFTAVYEVL